MKVLDLIKLCESITFGPSVFGNEGVHDLLDFTSYAMKYSYYNGNSKSIIDKLNTGMGFYDIFTVDGDWSKNNVANLYLNYKLDNSDKGDLLKLIEDIKSFAEKKGVKLGKIQIESGKSESESHYRKEKWTGPKIWNPSDGVSKIRVIRFPVLSFSDQERVPEMNLSNSNAEVIFELLGIEFDYVGTIKHSDIPKYMRKLMSIKNRNYNYGAHTKDSVVDRGKVSYERGSDNVINLKRGATMYDFGRDEEYVKRVADRLMKIFDYAQKNNLDISWG